MQVRIGTSGYSYADWRGPFYPPGIASHEMLAFYARHFPAVEINSSFYRAPSREQVARMAQRVPPDFGFTLKAPQSISHGHSFDDLPSFQGAANELAARGQLLGLLVQMPESFHNTAPGRDWLIRIRAELQPHRVAVEFRHRSWAAVNLTDWLEHVGLDVVSVAAPEIPSLFPSGLRLTNRRIYVRLHSLNAANWYAGGKARYDYDFTEDQLGGWARALKAIDAAGRADDCVIFLNNCVDSRAITNAKQLRTLIRKSTPAMHMIDPPTAPRQPSLFEE
jgi:uncharacterized protein YecE (DUF72 family)